MAGLTAPILLITDLSARCDRAMDRAVSLAQTNGVKLIVLHVTDTPWVRRLTQPNWQAQQEQHLKQAQTRLRRDLPETTVDIEVLVEQGDIVEVIEQVATNQHCGLIVSGTARDETLGRIVLGNTVQRLARRVAIPLLIVRHRGHQPYNDVVVASDFSAGSAHALKVASRLFADAAITLYHGFDEVAGIYALDEPSVREQTLALQKQGQAFVQTTLNSTPADLSILIEHGSVTERLPALVESQGINIVTVGTHGISGMVRMAMGSIAESLLDRLNCDVLVVPQDGSGT